jgi:hypothetical protein
MKSLLSILLIVITSVYVLPVKQMLVQKATLCCTDMEEKKAEKDKDNKEKIKELFQPYQPCYTLQSFTAGPYYFIDCAVNTQVPAADIPPPDCI